MKQSFIQPTNREKTKKKQMANSYEQKYRKTVVFSSQSHYETEPRAAKSLNAVMPANKWASQGMVAPQYVAYGDGKQQKNYESSTPYYSTYNDLRYDYVDSNTRSSRIDSQQYNPFLEKVNDYGDLTKEILSHLNGTHSSGYSASLTPGIYAFNGNAGYSIDTDGNLGQQYGLTGAFHTGNPSASLSRYYNDTNAPSIYHLEGMGYRIGGSLAAPVSGIPMYGGFDVDIIPDDEADTHYYGTTRSSGVGVPGGEYHIEFGKTFGGVSVNLFELWKKYMIILEV